MTPHQKGEILKKFAQFEVTLKAQVWHNDKILLLITPDGYYDFPGGRIGPDEVTLSHFKVMDRELQEEIGSDVQYSVGDFAFVARRHYTYDGTSRNVIALHFDVTYLGGKVSLSDEHCHWDWHDPFALLNNPDKFQSTDEYEEFSKYLTRKKTNY